jgi:hypothetical protein
MKPISHLPSYLFKIHIDIILPSRSRSSKLSLSSRFSFQSFVCSLAGPVKGWTASKSGFDSRQEQEILYSPQRPDRLWGPPSLLSKRYWRLFPRGVKRPEHEPDHSHLHLVPRLIKQRDNFTLPYSCVLHALPIQVPVLVCLATGP